MDEVPSQRPKRGNIWKHGQKEQTREKQTDDKVGGGAWGEKFQQRALQWKSRKYISLKME